MSFSDNTDFAALYASNTPDLTCGKCQGTGKFRAHSGRIVGDCFTCKGTGVKYVAPAKPAMSAISVDKIELSFEAAKGNGIARPKLRLDTFTFSIAPATGRNAGSIYVKESELYLGKITDGQFQPSRDCDAETTTRIVAAASDPASSAKAYGMRTGSCSCCGRELTNGLSIDLGIGPICREKFGWG